MKWNKLIILLGLLVLGTPAVYAQYEDFDDAIYISPEQAAKARTQAIEEERLARERYRQQLEREQSAYALNEYYDEEYSPNDSEIDAYNRRGKGKQETYAHRKKEGNAETQNYTAKKKKYRKYRGIYSDRIARFHDPSTIVIQGGDCVEIYLDNEYYGSYYDNGYYYGGDSDINIYIINNPYYGNYAWNSYYPWYSSRWDYLHPWYYGGYYPHRYHHYYSWHNRGWHWGWSFFGYSPSHFDAWHDGYHAGYWDGYYGYGGYFGRSHYDPYAGVYTYRENKYTNGRRNNDSFGAQYNESRNRNNRNSSVSTVTRERNDLSISGRNSVSTYDRGTYWSDNSNRSTDNDRNFDRRDYRGNNSVYNRSNRGNYSEGRGISRQVERSSDSRNRNTESYNRGSYESNRNYYDRGTQQQRYNSSSTPVQRNDNNHSTYNRRNYESSSNNRSSSSSYNRSSNSSFERSSSSSTPSRSSFERSGSSNSSSGSNPGGGRRGR